MNKNGIIIATAISTILATTITTANAEVVYRYKGDSDYATVKVAGFKGVEVRVDRVKVKSTAGGEDTHITKLYYSSSPYAGYVYWSGEIANSDFSGDPSGKMTLHTNTCDYNPTLHCGVVNLSWTNDMDSSTQTSGIERTETPYFIIHKSGTTKYSNASVSGSVLDANVNLTNTTGSIFGYGFMGSDRASSMTITNK